MTERLAIVTGSSSGLGLAVAGALLEAGWQVRGISRRMPPISHPAYRHLPVDLAALSRHEGAVSSALDDWLRNQHGGKLALVNNAGDVRPVLPMTELDAEQLQRAFALNTVAPLWLMGAVLRRMSRGDVRVVNVSSGAAVKAYPGWAAYCSSKAALRMSGLVAAEEYERMLKARHPELRLSVLSYQPGVVDTPMQAVLRETPAENFPDRPRFEGMKSRGELSTPDRPAREIVRWLEEPAASLHEERRFGADRS